MTDADVQRVETAEKTENLYDRLRLRQSKKDSSFNSWGNKDSRYKRCPERARKYRERADAVRAARQRAIKNGDVRFSPGVACRHGHIGEWYTLPNQEGAACAECRAINVSNWESKNFGVPPATRPMPDNCECCGRPQGVKKFHRDHDHKTGKFRGWLCTQCNLGIGKLGDDVAGLEVAIEYLKRTT